MTVRYHARGARMVPEYMCQSRNIQRGRPVCQQIAGSALDDAIGMLLVETVTPLTLEVALAVQKELESRCDETERFRLQEVERARYQSDLARRRFMQVDPDNRLVAGSLEAEWNQALRALAEAKERYEEQRQADRAGFNDEQRAAIMALAKDFPRLWNDPHTPQREHKRMARLLIADVTLLKGKDLRAQVRFNGGATHTLTLALPKPAWMLRQTSATVITEINRLLDEHTEGEIAHLLNRQGTISGAGKRFNRMMVTRIRSNYGLESRYSRLQARGLLTVHEIAAHHDVSPATANVWRRAGLLKAHRYNDKGQCLFEQSGPDAPIKYQYQRKNRVKSASSKAALNSRNS
jgi:hypothetical protein